MEKFEIVNLTIAAYGAILATLIAIYNIYFLKRKKIAVEVTSGEFSRINIPDGKHHIDDSDIERKHIVMTTVTNLKERAEKVSPPSITSLTLGRKKIPLKLILDVAPISDSSQQFYTLESGEWRQFSMPSELLIDHVLKTLENISYDSKYAISDNIQLQVAPNKRLVSRCKLLFDLEAKSVKVTNK